MNEAIEFLMLTNDHNRKSERSEVSEELIASVKENLLHRWPPAPNEVLFESILKDTPRYGLRLRQIGNRHNGFVEIFEEVSNEINELVAFGVCWSKEHADEIWSMLTKVHLKELILPEQPTVPWIATHLYLTDTINDPDLLSWSGDLQRSIAWAIAPNGTEDQDIVQSQGMTQERTSPEKEQPTPRQPEPLLKRIIPHNSIEARLRRTKQWLRQITPLDDEGIAPLERVLTRRALKGEDFEPDGGGLWRAMDEAQLELRKILENKKKLTARKAAENYTQYITHLTIFSGDSRESPRSEVNDHDLAKFRATLLKHWPPKPGHTTITTLVPGEPNFRFRMRKVPDGNNAFVEIFATRRRKMPIISFGICWSEEHAPRIWSMLEEIESTGMPIPNRPGAPWIAVQIHPLQILLNPNVARWAGDFERLLGWAIAPLHS